MSEFKVEVVELKDVRKHPNADTLSVADVNGYPVIFRTDDFKEGDLAVYVPIDAVVPDTTEWAFLNGKRRIRAKKLRGVFSMGTLAPMQVEWANAAGEWMYKPGDDVAEPMGITKYTPPVEAEGKGIFMSTENEPDPGHMPKYTDLEGLRRYPNVLVDGEEVVLTEKIHGANARFVFADGRLWVGSHNCIKKFDERNIWWKVAQKYDLEAKLAKMPGIAIYGEVYGKVQDLRYGLGDELGLRLFDALQSQGWKYLDYDDFVQVAAELQLETVPLLHRGPWSRDLLKLAEGPTTLGGGHVREGFVVRPVKERWDGAIGRVALKMVGEGYLLRKEA